MQMWEKGLSYGILLSVLLFCAVQDYRYRKISAIVLGIGFLLEGVVRFCFGGLSADLLYALLPGGLFLVSFFILRGNMGIGDVLAVLLIGWSIGSEAVLKSIFVSFVLMLLAAGYLLCRKRLQRTTRLPYLPFLLGGVLCSLI